MTHLVEWLRAAQPQVHDFDQVTVWAGAATLSAIEERGWLRKECDPLLNRSLPFRVFWQRFKLAKLARAAGCHVLWVPGGSEASDFRPMVTMSRNMLPFEWREMRRYGFTWRTLKIVLLHFAQKRAFQRADGLIFLCNYAHDTIVKLVDNHGLVAVIPHGIDGRFSMYPRPQQPITRYTTEHPFRLLYVSVVDVHKHQWHVAAAVARLRQTGLPVALDLVGPAYAPAMRRLGEALKRVDPESRFIRYLGAVPHAELHRLYATADMKVFASSCENMPNILLEAMAAGLPIACSGCGPMRELLGDAGVYFDPDSPDDIGAAIRTLIESPEMRLDKARAAFERAQLFSWSRCADETLRFIAQVGG